MKETILQGQFCKIEKEVLSDPNIIYNVYCKETPVGGNRWYEHDREIKFVTDTIEKAQILFDILENGISLVEIL